RSVGALSKTKGKLSGRPCQLASLMRKVAGGCAVDHALHDALPDGSDAEETIGEIRIPLARSDVVETHACEISRAILLDAWNAERRKIVVGKTTERLLRQVPGQHVIGEIRHRVAKRRKLPVQKGNHPRLGR